MVPEYHLIDCRDHPLRSGFANLYQVAFAEAPYFETYSVDEVVNNVWNPHIDGQHCVIVATLDGAVVGLGCAHSAQDKLSTIGVFLAEKAAENQTVPFNLESTVYMSELAVGPHARKHGIGTELVKRRMDWARKSGFTHYCMRTAAVGSNSRMLYERLGAKIAPFVQSITSEGVVSSSEQRIIMYNSL
ncbi:MAG: GNAT family N-acetyltransferase [Candidatus Paceibacteria bacterium]